MWGEEVLIFSNKILSNGIPMQLAKVFFLFRSFPVSEEKSRGGGRKSKIEESGFRDVCVKFFLEKIFF